MKFSMTIMTAAVLAVGGWSAKADAQELSRKQQSACGAVLCLAAMGAAPGECAGYLREYYSITASRPSRLARKRRDFLNMCPSNAPGLVNSLVSGQCNPTYQTCAPAGIDTEDKPGDTALN